MTATTGQYRSHLHSAYEFTASLGANFIKLPLVRSEPLIEQFGEEVHRVIAKLGVTDFSGAIGQCVKWSHALRPHVERALGIPILLTFGQVYNGQRSYFNPSLPDLERWYRDGFAAHDFEGRTGMNLHAWWTLPSGEIVDITLWSTLSAVWKKPEYLGAITGGWPDEIAPSPTYLPLVVGDDYIETVDRHLLGGSFLANECTAAALNAF